MTTWCWKETFWYITPPQPRIDPVILGPGHQRSIWCCLTWTRIFHRCRPWRTSSYQIICPSWQQPMPSHRAYRHEESINTKKPTGEPTSVQSPAIWIRNGNWHQNLILIQPYKRCKMRSPMQEHDLSQPLRFALLRTHCPMGRSISSHFETQWEGNGSAARTTATNRYWNRQWSKSSNKHLRGESNRNIGKLIVNQQERQGGGTGEFVRIKAGTAIDLKLRAIAIAISRTKLRAIAIAMSEIANRNHKIAIRNRNRIFFHKRIVCLRITVNPQSYTTI